MATATATRVPKVTGVVLEALLAQRGGFVLWDCTPEGAGAVYAIPFLTDAQADNRDLIVLQEYAEVAHRVHEVGIAAAAKAVTAIYANAAARGLL